MCLSNGIHHLKHLHRHSQIASHRCQRSIIMCALMVVSGESVGHSLYDLDTSSSSSHFCLIAPRILLKLKTQWFILGRTLEFIKKLNYSRCEEEKKGCLNLMSIFIVCYCCYIRHLQSSKFIILISSAIPQRTSFTFLIGGKLDENKADFLSLGFDHKKNRSEARVNKTQLGKLADA